MKKMKIFFMCTHSNQGTGYARSANKITNFLADLPGVEVVYYAFQNYQRQAIADRFIDPRIRFIDAVKEDPSSPKGFGDRSILPHFDREKPDVLFMYNDLPVCCSILDILSKSIHTGYKKMAYLDLVYPWEDVIRLDALKRTLDHCFVFLRCWQKHLVGDLGWDADRVTVLPLGVDSQRFHRIDQHVAKRVLGFQEDDFVVLNMNRNSYRKQWNVTVAAFLKFLKRQAMNPKIKLYCGCLLKTTDGYDIERTIVTESIKLGLDYIRVLENHTFFNSMALCGTDEYVNVIYNACDVGLNTCCGEGFGLTNVEHACLEKPQIVSGVPALKETLGEHAIVVEPALWSQVAGFEDHGGDVALFDPNDFAEALNLVYTHKVSGRHIKKHIEATYTWDRTYDVLKTVFALED